MRISITVIVEENGRREQGYGGGGGRFDYAYFTDDVLARYAKEAVGQALLNLSAREAPRRNPHSGTSPTGIVMMFQVRMLRSPSRV